MKYAYIVMFNLRTLGGECHWLENITFHFGAFNMFECEPASEPLARHLDGLFRPCENDRQKQST